jgi:hypothetical protein
VNLLGRLIFHNSGVSHGQLKDGCTGGQDSCMPESRMFSTQTLQIGWVRGAARVVRHRVVEIAAFGDPTMTVERIVALTRTYSLINPAATQRQVQALTAQLLTVTTSKAGPATKAQLPKRMFT